MEQKKKVTNKQLQKRIENAILHIEKTKETQSVFFSDRGLRLTVNEEYAVLATGYHRHVFTNYTSSGVSRPYLYTKRIVELALANDCQTEKGYSFQKLMETLKSKDDKSEYNIAVYVDWWIHIIIMNLYSIGESEAEAFMVYFKFVTSIAINEITLSEKTESMTNKQFIERFIKNVKEFTADIEERVIFEKKTDEEFVQENIEAIQQEDVEQFMQESANDENKD